MAQLEKIYLMNVILYLNSLHVLLEFIQINKKCKEALQMLHINPFYSTHTLRKEIDLFCEEAKLQTIRTDDLSLKSLEMVDRIEAYNIFFNDQTSNHANKIVKLTIFPSRFVNYDIFVNLKKIICKLNRADDFNKQFIEKQLKDISKIPTIEGVTFDLRSFGDGRVKIENVFNLLFSTSIKKRYEMKVNSKGSVIKYYFIADWSVVDLKNVSSMICDNITIVTTVAIDDDRILLFGDAVNNWKVNELNYLLRNANKYYAQHVSMVPNLYSPKNIENIDVSHSHMKSLVVNRIHANLSLPTSLTSLELNAYSGIILNLTPITLLNISICNARLPNILPNSITSLSLENPSFEGPEWILHVQNLKKLAISSAFSTTLDDVTKFKNLTGLSLIGMTKNHLKLTNLRFLSSVSLELCYFEVLALPYCTKELTLSYNVPKKIIGYNPKFLPLTNQKLKKVKNGVVKFNSDSLSCKDDKKNGLINEPRSCKIM
ncbi:Leucine-rich repeat containing protein [Entamoeba marina]